MSPLFIKLNHKGQKVILVMDPPATFQSELARLKGISVRSDAAELPSLSFALVFVQTLAQVAKAASLVLPKAEGDAIIWFAYPKGTSKRYTCDFNRDTGWESVRRAGFDTVRQVAIDEDWSALRFRRVEYIKTTSPAQSSTGKKAKPPKKL